MGLMQWLLESVLIGLLGATLFHALRLERALGVVKRDRTDLEALVHSFNDSTHQAESGIQRLRDIADEARRALAAQAAAAASLRDELGFMIERAERAADRMEAQQRPAREPEPRRPEPPFDRSAMEADLPRVRSQAERDLLRALRVAR